MEKAGIDGGRILMEGGHGIDAGLMAGRVLIEGGGN